MLRVGQMAMAEALRRTEGIDKYGDPDTFERVLKKIISKNGLFSIENMVKQGRIIF